MATLYNEYYYDESEEVGITIKRLETKQYWDGAAWVATEPKPMLMVRESKPTDGVRSLDIAAPVESFPPGDYVARVWKLAADGSAVELIDMLPHFIPRPRPEIKFSSGVTGYAGFA